jgi:hypothetical protein
MNLSEEEAGKCDVHQDTLAERFAQDFTNEPVPVQAVSCKNTEIMI